MMTQEDAMRVIISHQFVENHFIYNVAKCQANRAMAEVKTNIKDSTFMNSYIEGKYFNKRSLLALTGSEEDEHSAESKHQPPTPVDQAQQAPDNEQQERGEPAAQSPTAPFQHEPHLTPQLQQRVPPSPKREQVEKTRYTETHQTQKKMMNIQLNPNISTITNRNNHQTMDSRNVENHQHHRDMSHIRHHNAQ